MGRFPPGVANPLVLAIKYGNRAVSYPPLKGIIMGIHQDRYLDYVESHPEITNMHFSWNLESIAEHFGTTTIQVEIPTALSNGKTINLPNWVIDWDNATGTKEEHLEFLYEYMMLFIEAAKNAKPFSFNDRHGLPPLSHEPIDVQEFIDMTPLERKKHLNTPRS